MKLTYLVSNNEHIGQVHKIWVSPKTCRWPVFPGITDRLTVSSHMSQENGNWLALLAVAWSLSHVRLFATPLTPVRHAPLSRGFPRWENRSELPFPSPGGLSDQWTEPRLLHLQAESLPVSLQGRLTGPKTYRHWRFLPAGPSSQHSRDSPDDTGVILKGHRHH